MTLCVYSRRLFVFFCILLFATVGWKKSSKTSNPKLHLACPLEVEKVTIKTLDDKTTYVLGDTITLIGSFPYKAGTIEEDLKYLDLQGGTKFYKDNILISPASCKLPPSSEHTPLSSADADPAPLTVECVFKVGALSENNYHLEYEGNETSCYEVHIKTQPIKIRVGKIPVTMVLNSDESEQGGYADGDNAKLTANLTYEKFGANDPKRLWRYGKTNEKGTVDWSVLESCNGSNPSELQKLQKYHKSKIKTNGSNKYDCFLLLKKGEAPYYFTVEVPPDDPTYVMQNTAPPQIGPISVGVGSATISLDRAMDWSREQLPTAPDPADPLITYEFNQYDSTKWEADPSSTLPSIYGNFKIQISANPWGKKVANWCPRNGNCRLKFYITSMEIMDKITPTNSNFINFEKTGNVETCPYATCPVLNAGGLPNLRLDFAPRCDRIVTDEEANYVQFGCNFMPIADHFKLKIRLRHSTNESLYQEQSFEIKIQPSNRISRPRDYTDSGCGLHGTLKHRIFDCAMKVTAPSAYIVELASTEFASNAAPSEPADPKQDPNNYWILVNCPKIGGDGQKEYTCAWLSPTLLSSNPVMGTNFLEYLSFKPNTTNANPPATGAWQMNDYINGRILWSGQFLNAELFEEHKGWATFYLYDTSKTNELEYPLRIYKNLYERNGNDSCLEYAQNQWGALFSEYPDWESETLGAPYNDQRNIIPWLGLRYYTQTDWLLPSYPQVLTLTGGTGSRYEQWYTLLDAKGFHAYKVSGFNSTNSASNDIWSTSNTTTDPSRTNIIYMDFARKRLDLHTFQENTTKRGRRCAMMVSSDFFKPIGKVPTPPASFDE